MPENAIRFRDVRPPPPPRSGAYRPGRRAFTLLEAMLATIIVGVAFVAVLQLIATGTVVNVDAAELTTGVNLARNVRELALQTPYAQLSTRFNGATLQPPQDSRGVTLVGLDEWQQAITVQPVDPERLTANVVDSTPAAVRMTVNVRQNGESVCSLTWYSFDATP